VQGKYILGKEQMKEITTEDAIYFLCRAIETKGADFIYPFNEDGYCFYEKDDNPDCIIGHALFYAGWSIQQLRELDRLTSSALSQSFMTTDSMNFLRENKVTDAAIRIFAVAQDVQDRESGPRTWGDALIAAEKAMLTGAA
jgi:hypothetical protein